MRNFALPWHNRAGVRCCDAEAGSDGGGWRQHPRHGESDPLPSSSSGSTGRKGRFAAITGWAYLVVTVLGCVLRWWRSRKWPVVVKAWRRSGTRMVQVVPWRAKQPAKSLISPTASTQACGARTAREHQRPVRFDGCTEFECGVDASVTWRSACRCPADRA